MPPKPKKNEPSKKTEQKKKEKVIEDKTFGLKNKKGAKTQKFIQQVEKQVKQGNVKSSRLDELSKQDREKKKLDKKQEQDELNQLFKPVQALSKGADPKSVVCAFYKQGQCSKGDKCKFSHDLNLSRKGEKRNAYEVDEEDAADTMENWDEAKLEDVVNKKHGESDKAKLKTAIICKYFLEAVENSKYGWFWECPNGKACIYRHALPPGFMLKKDIKKENQEEKISIEDLIERERAALGYNTSPVTLVSFLQWKAKKKQEKLQALSADKEKKLADYKAGKTTGISGRQIFEFNPDLIAQDDDEAQDQIIPQGLPENEEDEESDTYVGTVVDVNVDSYGMTDVDGTGTQRQRVKAPSETTADEVNKLAEASALPDTDESGRLVKMDAEAADDLDAVVNGQLADDMCIDEDLFAGDDIDQVEDDLETLDLDD